MSPAKAWWQRYGLTALLGIAACGGLAALGIETDWGKNLRASGAPERGLAGATDLTPTLPAFKMGELDAAFKESGERPLFTPSRRPPPPVQTAAAPQMKRGQFKLAGTVVNADVSVAYLVELAGNKTLRVNKGAEVLGQAGLTVESVDANRVVLKLGDETEILELKTSTSPPAPPLTANANAGQVSVPGVGSVPTPRAAPQPAPQFMPLPAPSAAVQPASGNVVSQERPAGPNWGGIPKSGVEAAVAETFEARRRQLQQAQEQTQGQDGAAQRRRRFQNPANQQN